MRRLARLVGLAMAVYVRLVAATCRVDGRVHDGQAVLAFWHEYNLAAAITAHRLRRDQRHVSFSTRTFRGEVMNAMLAFLDAGSPPAEREADRSEAARLLRDLARLGREGASLAVSPDGPIGPYRRAKPGALIVAREARLALVPWAISARPALRLSRRWDRHIVPLPFCRLHVHEADHIEISAGQRLRPLLGRLQAALDDASARADANEASGR